jgi:DNA replication protein DnaC
MSSLDLILRELHLGTMVRHAQEVAIRAEREGWSFTRYLHDLMEMELLERGQRRIQKRLKESGLPTGKTLTTLELSRLPEPVRRQLPTLCEGHFVERGHNILAFGLPGRGKTHLLCAIGHALIERGYRVLFMPAFKLVQRLLTAKHELRLEKELRRLESQPQSSSMTSVTSSRTAMRWGYCLPSSPNGMSAKACSSVATWSSANGTASSKTL